MESKERIPVKLSVGTIEETIWLTEETYRLSVRSPEMSEGVVAGQFFMIKGWDGSQPLLRRPFSVSDIEGDILSFVIKITGKGTKLIADRKKGDDLSILGPLGNGFTLYPKIRNHIFVAGGVGIAPFPMLEKELKARNPACDIDLLYGERDSSRLIDTDRLGFRETRVTLVTEDGSRGSKGMVTDLLFDRFSRESSSIAIYACGPNAMLKAIQGLAPPDSVPLQFSLESYMGCGMGSCMGCVIPVTKDGKSGYSRVCYTGPVFEGREVVL